MENSISKFEFNTPCTCIIVGPTSSGKSHLMKKIITYKDDIFSTPPNNIIWCYGVYQKLYDELKTMNIQMHEGLPNIEEIPPNTLLILDDLMTKIDKSVCTLFTMHSHHRNISTFLITQNIFHQNKAMRDITLNAHYLILLAQRRDVSQIHTLAGQILPYRREEFTSVYKEATSKPYGYLLCSFHPRNKHRFYLRYNIFPSEIEIVYYPS